MARSTRVCQGYTKTGQKCKRAVGARNNTGYCRKDHANEANQRKFEARKNRAQGMSSDHLTPRAIRSRKNAPGKAAQGIDNGALYANLNQGDYPRLDRNKVPAKNMKNWDNPAVREAVSRSATMKAQQDKNTEVMQAMRTIMARRVEQKGLWDNEGNYAIKDSRGNTIGVLTRKEKKGNFSGPEFAKNISENPEILAGANPDDYAEKGLDSAALKGHSELGKYYDDLRGESKDRLRVYATDDAKALINDMYLDRYSYDPIDSGKLKYWRTDHIATEMLRLQEENNSLTDQIANDNDDIHYSLPDGVYTHTSDSGVDLKVQADQEKGRWSATNLKKLDDDVRSKIEGDPSVWVNKFTTKSVQKGDKLRGTSLWEKGKKPSNEAITFRDIAEYAG